MMNDVLTLDQSLETSKSNKLAYRFIKRVFDILCSIIGILCLIPLTYLVKICYLFSGDNHSVYYTQYRIGKNGKLFKIYKFRSMIPNADEALDKILAENEDLREEYRVYKKLRNDPRITKVGKFLRKTSLDELPQFINVLLGQMSVIGNRPYMPKEIDDMGFYYEDIVSSKPGITGIWQTSGRSDTTFRYRCIIESFYSNNLGLLMDIKIFFKTFIVLFKGL